MLNPGSSGFEPRPFGSSTHLPPTGPSGLLPSRGLGEIPGFILGQPLLEAGGSELGPPETDFRVSFGVPLRSAGFAVQMCPKMEIGPRKSMYLFSVGPTSKKGALKTDRGKAKKHHHEAGGDV